MEENNLTFPLFFIMKVIMTREARPGENRRALESVFDGLALPHGDWSEKMSGQGKYVSYSVHLTAADKDQFVRAHEQVGDLPGVRYVL